MTELRRGARKRFSPDGSESQCRHPSDTAETTRQINWQFRSAAFDASAPWLDNLTPMMHQYQRLRASVPADTLLLFRLGDFYELFLRMRRKPPAC